VAALRQFTTEELDRQAGQLDEALTTLHREENIPAGRHSQTATAPSVASGPPIPVMP
jgi:hypothetical protein